MSEPNARRTTHLTRDELGYAEDEDYWGIVGMLHDIDFEQWPQQHCVKSLLIQ